MCVGDLIHTHSLYHSMGRGTDRHLHCPHLTWQVVTVRSDQSVPALFICCLWERSCGAQIAFAQRDSHHCFEVWASVCVHELAVGTTNCTYLCQGKIKSVHGFYLLMTSLCLSLSESERRRFVEFSRRLCCCRSTSRCECGPLSGSGDLSGFVMYWAQSIALAPVLQQRSRSETRSLQRLNPSTYVPGCSEGAWSGHTSSGQLCPLRWWQTPPTQSIKPGLKVYLFTFLILSH